MNVNVLRIEFEPGLSDRASPWERRTSQKPKTSAQDNFHSGEARVVLEVQRCASF